MIYSQKSVLSKMLFCLFLFPSRLPSRRQEAGLVAGRLQLDRHFEMFLDIRATTLCMVALV